MGTNLLDIAREQNVDESTLAVTDAFSAGGQAITGTATSSVRLKNYNPSGSRGDYDLEYQVGSGAWGKLPGGTDVTLSINLATTTLKVRRKATAVASVTIKIEKAAAAPDVSRVVVSSAAPSDADGRPDGTIYIRTA